MRVLITGASGFVGRHLSALVSAEGGDPVGVGRTPPADAPPGEFHAADLLDPGAASETVRAAAPDAVVHLAARASVAESWDDPVGTVRDNVTITHHLLEAIRAHAPSARVLLAGSGDEYGPPPPDTPAITEDQELAPTNPYAVSKVASEYLGGFYADAHGLHVIRTRAFNHAGPGQSDAYVLSALARRVAQAELEAGPDGAATIDVGNTEVARDFTDVRDLVRAYRLAVEAADPGVYNVCSGTATTIAAVIERLQAMTDLTLETRTDPSLLRPVDATTVRGSAERLTAATGWRPEIPLDRTLADTLDWWRAELRA